MRRFLDIIGSCLLIIIAVFAIYLCVYLGFELSSSVNGENIQQEQPEEPHVHTFGEWQVITAATCAEEGQEQRLCECGETETRTIAATGHNYTETIVAPTCTEQGYTLHTCTNCEHTYTDNEIVALGHEFGEWEIDVDPTYTQEGSKHRTCTRCDAEETEAISKLDVVIEIEENLLIIPEINPSEGTINLYYTEVGSDVTASYVIGNVTSFDLTTLLTIEYMPMEAGKTYELKIMYDSSAGDYIYSNVITYESPVNYEYDGYWLYDIEGAGTWVIRMTETTFELAEAIKVDGKYETTTDYELFNLNANTLEGNHLNLYVNPDDTSEVYLYYDTTTNLLVYGGIEASRINEEDVSVHAHTYGEYETVVQYTCTTGGQEKRTCSVCGFEQLKVIPSRHTYTDDYLNNTMTCSVCGLVKEITNVTKSLKFQGYSSSGDATSSSPAYYNVKGCSNGISNIFQDTTKVYVPNINNNKTVKEINNNAFSGVSNVNYIYVSDGITIAANAFLNCYDLHYLSLPSTAQGITFDFTGCPSDLVVYYHS